MVALNFIKQFADDVESGEKTQTIRKQGKRAAPEVGSTIQLYTGMRTKQCRLLGSGRVLRCQPIIIRPWVNELLLHDWASDRWVIFDSDKSLSKFSSKDGFESISAFFEYFKKVADNDRSFRGNLIEWELM